ncbi:MAG: SH3 domain-containing protein [Bacteroidetes bacterium]|nr:SH3 domain-containing protein [Bacteroidota bacterium]
MKNFFLLIFLFVTNCNVHCQDRVAKQKLCGERIALISITSNEPDINGLNSKVLGILKTILVNKSTQCTYVSREQLGDLLNFIESESNLVERYNRLPNEYAKKLLIQDITYVAVLETSHQSLGEIEGAASKVSFYDLNYGYPTIELNTSYTLAEISRVPEVIKERLENEITDLLNCDETDEIISKLSRDVAILERDVYKSIENQIRDCENLQKLKIEYESKGQNFRKKNKNLFDYLDKQAQNCEIIKQQIESLENKKMTLDEKLQEKKPIKTISETPKKIEIVKENENVVYAIVDTDGSPLKMRKLPTTSAPKICEIPIGTKVKFIEYVGTEKTIYHRTGKWCRIEYNDKIGYVFGGYLIF